jgi:hypothetical protein
LTTVQKDNYDTILESIESRIDRLRHINVDEKDIADANEQAIRLLEGMAQEARKKIRFF